MSFTPIHEDDLGCGLSSVSGSFLDRSPAAIIDCFVAIGAIKPINKGILFRLLEGGGWLSSIRMAFGRPWISSDCSNVLITRAVGRLILV